MSPDTTPGVAPHQRGALYWSRRWRAGARLLACVLLPVAGSACIAPIIGAIASIGAAAGGVVAGTGAAAATAASVVGTATTVAGSTVAVATTAQTQLVHELQASLAAKGAAAAPLPATIAASAGFVPNEILVTNLSRRALDWARAKGFGIREAGALDNLSLTMVRLQTPKGMSLEKALAALQKVDPAGQFERNPVYRMNEDEGGGDCSGTRCYGQQLVRWPARCDVAARIGMIDGGVDARHRALATRAVETRRFAAGAPSARESSHATAIAALLVGASGTGFAGLLSESQLFAADVFSPDAVGAPYTDAARLAAALDWLAGHQPSVVNISLAGPDSRLLASAVARVLQSGTGVVASVGNLGPAAPPLYPAAYAGVLGVTAVDRQRRVYAKANRGTQIALAAPGVAIWTVGPQATGRFRDGTSFATPFVAAAYAVLATRRADLTPPGVASALRQSALPLGDASSADTFGAGLLQAPACH